MTLYEALKQAIDVFDGMNDDEINLELLPGLRAALKSGAAHGTEHVEHDELASLIADRSADRAAYIILKDYVVTRRGPATECALSISGGVEVDAVAWVALSNDQANIRIWWRRKDLAEEWSKTHSAPLIPLYAHPRCADALLPFTGKASEAASGPMEFNKPEPTDKDAETLSGMSAQIWAAGASMEDAEFIAKMLWRNGFDVTKRDVDGWKDRFFDAIKHLHEALDVIESIDSECLLPGQLKDLVDGILVHRT